MYPYFNPWSKRLAYSADGIFIFFFLIFLCKSSLTLHGQTIHMKCSALFYCKILKQIGICTIFSTASGSNNCLGRSSSTCKVTREKWARLDKSDCHMKMNIGRLRRPPPLIQNLNGAIRNHRRLWSKYFTGLVHWGYQLLFGYALWYSRLKY